jgi:hypothetical protein
MLVFGLVLISASPNGKTWAQPQPIQPILHPILLRFLGMEVTQAIQATDNTVPLVAGKRTFVRVYLQSDQHAIGIHGSLSAYGPAATIYDFGSQLSPPPRVLSLNAITVDSSNDIVSKRQNIAASLNFELPPEWIRSGRIHLSFTPLSVTQENGVSVLHSEVPCDGCENYGGSQLYPLFPRFVTFSETHPLQLSLFSVPYREEVSNCDNINSCVSSYSPEYTPRNLDFDMLLSWLRRAYPIASMNVIGGSWSTVSPPFNTNTPSPPRCETVNTRLAAYQVMMEAFPPPHLADVPHLYGLVSDGGGFMRGCAAGTPGTIASGPAGSSSQGPSGPDTSWDIDGSYADWYGGHEIGHQFGRSHPGFSDNCDGAQPRDDLYYPYRDGLISGPDLRYFGFDVGDGSVRSMILPNGIPQQVYRPDIWTDMMTYRCREWVSDYTYTAILQSFDNPLVRRLIPLSASDHDGSNAQSRNGTFNSIPFNTSLTSKRPGANAILKNNLGHALSQQQLAIRQALFVLGNIDLTNNTVKLEPFMILPVLKITPSSSLSKFAISLLDSKGTIIARYPFQPKQYTDIPADQHKTALISEVVPFVPSTKKIVISENNKELASRIIDTHAPQVRMLFPKGGESLKDNTIVRWESNDADGDNTTTYSLLYSPNAGKTWQPVAVGIKASEQTVNLKELPGGDKALFRIVATDGVNTGIVDTNGTFIVPPKIPVAHIIAPYDKSTFSGLQTIVFTGDAFDLEDGTLDGKALKWRSDQQGILGYGHSISATSLKLGLHTITLTAIDSNGKVGNTSIKILITPERIVEQNITTS